MKEKEDILEGLEEVIEQDKISVIVIRNIVISSIFVLVLLIPKVYLANDIYIYSVKINKYLHEYYSLKAENSILKSKIEKLKFKNRLNSYNLNF